MRHRHRGLSTYGSMAKDREMSTHAYAPSGRGTIYLYLTKCPLWEATFEGVEVPRLTKMQTVACISMSVVVLTDIITYFQFQFFACLLL